MQVFKEKASELAANNRVGPTWNRIGRLKTSPCIRVICWDNVVWRLAVCFGHRVLYADGGVFVFAIGENMLEKQLKNMSMPQNSKNSKN